ncbi:unnamed protein product, partial [Polarella glacialis]
VLFASSADPAHPAENLLSSENSRYWISTGLFPQEVLLLLDQPVRVTGVRLFSTQLRAVRLEGCREEGLFSATTLAEAELEEESQGQLQSCELPCRSEEAAPAGCVKIVISSGWSDFCSLHRVEVLGIAVGRPRSKESAPAGNPRKAVARQGSMCRRPDLKQLLVDIPDTAAPGKQDALSLSESAADLFSPLAPRMIRKTWSGND